MKRTERGSESAEPDLTQVRVQLKPIAGVRPGVYLTALYGLLAVAALFLFLVYPGLRSRGTYVTFVTRPEGAAVRVDGVYRGFTPAEILVPSGERTIEISWPGLVPITLSRTVAGPVFGTLLFKPRDRIEHDLEVQDVDELALARLGGYAAYAHEPGNGLLTETARVLTSPAILDADASRSLSGFLAAAMGFLAPPAGDLADYLNAWAIKSADGGVLGPGALASLVRSLAALASQRDYWLMWFLLNAPAETQQHALQQPWVSAELSRIASLGPRASVGQPVAAGPVTVAGVALRPVPGGTAVVGDDRRPFSAVDTGMEPAHGVAVAPFLMSETEITNGQFAAFLADVPSWRRSNLTELMRQGLVEDQYLTSWDGDAPPAERADHPVTNVSYGAAMAYAQWLGGRPGAPPGYRFRLPYEAEWEWAARGGGGRMVERAPLREIAGDGTVASGSTAPNGYGLREMMGNVWEWCADWYAPSAYFLVAAEARDNPADTSLLIATGSERVVRGGAWANEARQVGVYTRGSQPPTWTTPYLGFRVVAVPPPR